MQAPEHITNNLKNDFLAALCHSMKEGAAVIEKSTSKIIFCNESWLKMFDLESSAEMFLTEIEQYRKVKLTIAEKENRLQVAEQMGLFCEQAEYITKKGRRFWGELVLRPIKNREAIYYLVVLDKIDDLKDSEQRIAQDKQRFDALMEHASMGIIETNSHAAIVDINHFALELFGYTKEEVMNKRIELLIPSRFHFRHVGHRDKYVVHPKNRPMGLGMDLFAVKKDGTEFPVEVSLSNYSRNGERFVIAFLSDITVRKKWELEIKKLNDKLEDTVDQRTRELRTAVLQLERSKEVLSRSLEKEIELSELKSRFVSIASHEFRTPLSTVLSSAYLLEHYNTGEERPKREKHLRRIISSVNMLTDILNDFLSVGKIEEGKIYVKYSAFDIQNLIASITEEIRNNLKQGQVIHYHHEGNPMVVLDASMLKHIIMNLVSNASKFSPEASQITIHTKSGTGKVVLSVKDQGIGISTEDQKHLMERFFRGTNATHIQGTGLGLHIISKYVELLNGQIGCKSELQKGTEFTITFNINAGKHEEDPGN